MTQKLRRYPAAPLQHVYVEANSFSVMTLPDGNEAVRYDDIPGLGCAIRSELILKPAKLDGTEIAYLRKRLDLFQDELASLICTSTQTLSLWERGEGQISDASDALLRILCAERLKDEISLKAAQITSVDKASRLATKVATLNLVARRDMGKWMLRWEARASTYELRTRIVMDRMQMWDLHVKNMASATLFLKENLHSSALQVDFYNAVDAAMDRLESQSKKHQQGLVGHGIKTAAKA